MTSQLGSPLIAAGTPDGRTVPQAERHLRILLLEDDVADAELQVRALAAAGVEFTWDQVDTERAFIASLDSGAYDVILSDYNLPAFNGLRALQILRARGIDVPFILVSGALGEEAAIESLKLGATDYVLKGRLDRLAAVVRRALRDAEERRQRARAEAALRESEERYRSLVETAPDIIVTLSPDGAFSSVNPAFELVLGWSRSAWIGKPFAPIVHPDEMAVAEELFARSLRESVPTFELRVRTNSGDYLVQEMTATAQRRDGEVVGVLVIARDVTARTRAEMKMRTLVEIAKQLTGTFDLDALLTGMQERTAIAVPCDVVVTFGQDAQAETRVMSHYGVAPDLVATAGELAFGAGQPFDGLVSRGQSIRVDDTSTSDSPYAALFRRFRLSSALVTPLRSHDRHFGGLLIANYAVRPFDDEQADLCGAIAHQVAGALEAAEFQRLQHEEAQDASALARVAHELISSVDLPILLDRLCRVTADVLDAEVSYTLMLREEENAFVPVAGCGETPDRWEIVRAIKIPCALPDRQTPAGDGAAIHHAAEPLGEPLESELRAAYDLGAFVSVALQRGEQLIGIQVAGRRRAAAAFGTRQQRLARGIAQLASLALENARLVDKLEHANRLKSDFLATMSHELRTPLNVILGYNDLLLDEVFGHLTPEQAASLDRVGTSARELLELISATLDISRLETSRAALNLRDIDPVALLREIETETRSMLEKPDVEAVWRIAPNLPHLYSDAVKLKVLLKNLIANAAKFTDRGSVTISVEACDGGMEFRVADTGIGMSPDTLAVIFEPFRQGDSSSTRRHGGVGLGLYIVTRLLELLAGRIEVESEPGVGSTFRVWIQLDPLRGRGDRTTPVAR
jgi:PAS domain S-box-containing protein